MEPFNLKTISADDENSEQSQPRHDHGRGLEVKSVKSQTAECRSHVSSQTVTADPETGHHGPGLLPVWQAAPRHSSHHVEQRTNVGRGRPNTSTLVTVI